MLEKNRRSKKYIIILLILIICLAAFLIYQNSSNKDEASTSAVMNLTKYGLVYGNPDAPVKIIAYSSFQCPDCLKLHENSEQILNKYIDEGKILYVFKPTDTLYLRVPKEYGKDFGDLGKIFENRNTFAKISVDEAKKTLGENIYSEREALINQIVKETEDLKIETTPTIFINGEKLVGAYSKEDFQKILESIMSGKK